jgi:hypothetical protein
MTHPEYVRGTNPFCFRSGQWARVIRTDTRETDGAPCWFVEFPDGATDIWPCDDPVAGYETRGEHT